MVEVLNIWEWSENTNLSYINATICDQNVNKNGQNGIKVSCFQDFIILQQTQRCD